MSAKRSNMLSDFAKVDAYENTAADYEELPEVTSDDFDRAVIHVKGVPLRGRPPLGDRPKKQVTLRLDQDIIEHFRRDGNGWQSRINEALRKSL